MSFSFWWAVVSKQPFRILKHTQLKKYKNTHNDLDGDLLDRYKPGKQQRTTGIYMDISVITNIIVSLTEANDNLPGSESLHNAHQPTDQLHQCHRFVDWVGAECGIASDVAGTDERLRSTD